MEAVTMVYLAVGWLKVWETIYGLLRGIGYISTCLGVLL